MQSSQVSVTVVEQQTGTAVPWSQATDRHGSNCASRVRPTATRRVSSSSCRGFKVDVGSIHS